MNINNNRPPAPAAPCSAPMGGNHLIKRTPAKRTGGRLRNLIFRPVALAEVVSSALVSFAVILEPQSWLMLTQDANKYATVVFQLNHAANIQ